MTKRRSRPATPGLFEFFGFGRLEDDCKDGKPVPGLLDLFGLGGLDRDRRH